MGLLASVALPATALAADTYVDAGAGSDSNDCTVPTTPCATIAGPAGGLAQAGPGDTVFVADGTYPESVSLGEGKSLVSEDVSAPKPVIDNGSSPGEPAVTVTPEGAGRVEGFAIRSGYLPIKLNGDATVTDDDFDQATPPSAGSAAVAIDSGSPLVKGNDFTDPNGSGGQLGVTSSSPDSPRIAGNTFTDLGIAIVVADGTPELSGNAVTGAYPPGMFGLPGAGVFAYAGDPVISDNSVSAPASANSAGVLVGQPPLGGPTEVGAELHRNRLSGSGTGVEVEDTTLPVSLDSDLVVGNDVGLEATDTSGSAAGTDGDVGATNVTLFDNAGADVELADTTLALDSSVVGAPIVLAGDGHGACQISFSRGPAAGGANGCGDFKTSAGPDFVDAPSGDYHLAPGSPLIDAGNPAPPPPGSLDVDGGARALDGRLDGVCAPRRDIGADELVPGSDPDCSPPQGGPDTTPPDTHMTRRPRHRTVRRRPTFAFASSEPGSSFRCKVDRKPLIVCGSPLTIGRLRLGRHRFKVYAVDPSANADPTPIDYRFRVVRAR